MTLTVEQKMNPIRETQFVNLTMECLDNWINEYVFYSAKCNNMQYLTKVFTSLNIFFVLSETFNQRLQYDKTKMHYCEDRK